MLNKAQLIGNVGADPVVKDLPSGKLSNFNIATSESFKDKDGVKQEKTEWHRIVCFGNVAEIVEKYVRKGSSVYVEGKIQTRKYEDKDKVERYTTEIVVSTIRLLGKKNDENGTVSQPASAPANTSAPTSTPAPAAPKKQETQPAFLDNDSDDLPF